MILSRRVWLGSSSGPQLDEVHERVVVLGIDPGTPKETLNTAKLMGGAGSRISGQHWDELEVKVTFGIDVPKKSLSLRRQIFDDVKTWALTNGTGGHLYTSVMPGKRVYIDKVVLPSAGDLFEWTNSFDILFKAYSVPFWTDRTPAKASAGILTKGAVGLDVGGDVETVADVTFTNKSGKTINNFAVTAGNSRMVLSKISLGDGKKVEIVHTSAGLLRIRANGSSILEKRTGADDLTISPGHVVVSIETERAGELVVNAYGRYL